jgi:bifunctional DNase/RNase
MGKEVEGGRQVEGGGNWEISVTSPTRLEVDPQLAQAARLTPRPESKDLLFNIFHTISANLRKLKVRTYTRMRYFFQLFASSHNVVNTKAL